MLKFFIIGNLTRDPENGTTEGGVNWSRFTVAARKRYAKEGEPDAEFVRVTAWRGLGDTCAKYLKKGRKVSVVGEVRAHAWTGQDGQARGQLEMTADEVEFLSGGGSGSAPSDADAPPAPAARDAQSGMEVANPDDLPF